jgi:carbon-monoxide dehydrogenase large subunit
MVIARRHGQQRRAVFETLFSLCVLSVDPDTGEVHQLRYIAVDDFGKVLNEASICEQTQGGIGQGIGQAPMERVVYGADSGQFLVDFGLPPGLDLPSINWIDNGLRPPPNLRRKGVRRGWGSAPPALMNALADVLSSVPAARPLQVPANRAEIWRVIHAVG